MWYSNINDLIKDIEKFIFYCGIVILMYMYKEGDVEVDCIINMSYYYSDNFE